MAELHDTTAAKLAWLQELNEQAEHAGSEKAVARQRDRGKLLAGERVEKLLDPGSFVELDRYVRHRNPDFDSMANRPYGDAVVTGYGTIFGRKVFVFSQDFTVFGGSLSEVFAEKICKVMDLAVKYGCPVIGINDSGGARIQEGVVSLAGYAEIFWRNVQASGVVPQLSLVLGPCAGGAVYSPAITDFVLMAEGSSYMFITGPDVVKTVTGEEVTQEELGGAAAHAEKSGVAHLTAADEEAVLEDARYLLSFLPQNNLESPVYAAPSDPPDREAPELDTFIPDSATKPYDVKQVIAKVVDDGEFLEIQERYAENIVCGFARLAGPLGRDRREPAAGARRGARHRRVDEGRPLRPHLRRLQHPARHLRRRARLPPRNRAGVGRDHPSRSQAALRLRRGDRAEADRDPPQGVRRGVRRDELEAHPGRLQPRVADRRGGGDGAGGRRQHHLPPGARGGRRPRRAPRGADRRVQGTVREPLPRRRAGLRGRGDRAAADATDARLGARDGADEARARAEAEAGTATSRCR